MIEKPTPTPKYRKWPWFAAAALVPFVLIVLVTAIIHPYLVRFLGLGPESNFAHPLETAVLCSIVPAMIVLVILGFTQWYWRDGTTKPRSVSWICKRAFPFALVILAWASTEVFIRIALFYGWVS